MPIILAIILFYILLIVIFWQFWWCYFGTSEKWSFLKKTLSSQMEFYLISLMKKEQEQPDWWLKFNAPLSRQTLQKSFYNFMLHQNQVLSLFILYQVISYQVNDFMQKNKKSNEQLLRRRTDGKGHLSFHPFTDSTAFTCNMATTRQILRQNGKLIICSKRVFLGNSHMSFSSTYGTSIIMPWSNSSEEGSAFCAESKDRQRNEKSVWKVSTIYFSS